jgi:phospholipase C
MVDHAQPGLGRDRVKHIIVLMMENRSFDHLLGYLKHDDPAYPDLARLEPSCPVDPSRPEGRRVSTTATASSVLGNDPDHSHQAVMLQMFGRTGTPGVGAPTMTGFIESYRRKVASGTLRPLAWWEKVTNAVLTNLRRLWNWLLRRPGAILATPDEIMKCFPESEIPVLGFLAKQFAVLVNWHASVPGETWPNRQFAHAATSHGTANIEIGYYEDDTIFQRLGEAGRRWEIYHDGLAQVWVYPKLWLADVDHFHDMDRLFDDIANGTLPAYAFVEPNHGYGAGEGNSQHPGNNTTKGDSFLAGEQLMASIYNALVANPALFAQTLFLITYDEHGGFFDHVPPPAVTPPDDFEDSRTGFDFSLSGVRVPAVAISPLIPAGTVDPTFYEHATIPATVRRQFASGTKALSRRESAAADLLDHLPLLPDARTDVLPVPRPPQPAAPSEVPTGRALNEFQASLVELAGAVHIARSQLPGEAALRAERVDGVTIPPFTPHPSTHDAVEAGVIVPGSEADQIVADVVADFTREGPPPVTS